MASSGHGRVLLAHEDPATRARLEAWLTGWGYEVVSVADGSRAWETLHRDDAPRLVLLGTGIGGMPALEVCRAARSRPMEPYVYVALIGPWGDGCDVSQCVAAQADDFLTAPVDAGVLRVRLEAGRRVARMQEDLIAARDALRSRAASDALTGMWNRETVLSILGREIGRASREDGVVAVLMADLDHFKRVNDDYGHQAGDEVLRDAAQRMSSVIRPYDAVGRYGGEEFLFVLPGCDRVRALAAAERVLESVSADPICVPKGALRVTVSIGLAATGPEPRLDLDEVIRSADAALYRAKRGGRNRVVADMTVSDACADSAGPSPLSAVRALVELLRSSVESRDVRAVFEETREMRRIAGSIGAKGVVHLTRTLDARAEAGHWDTARGAVDAIAFEINRSTSQGQLLRVG